MKLSGKGDSAQIKKITTTETKDSYKLHLWPQKSHKWEYTKYTLTLDALKKLIIGNVDFVKGAVNLVLPQGHELVEGQNIGRGSHVHSFVQGSWVFHCFYGISGNIFLDNINSWNKNFNWTACLLSFTCWKKR